MCVQMLLYISLPKVPYGPLKHVGVIEVGRGKAEPRAWAKAGH